jgi:hypothetical protein
MVTVRPQPTEIDAWRQELRAVLQSPSFVRAPRLAHLLSHLCEKRFAGETSQIKEYSIGVEVFARGPDFDQDTDSIVRVEANRLRRRLAEYYAGQGASDPIRIVIPVGQYVPEFVAAPLLPAPPPADRLPSAPAAAAPPQDQIPPPSRRWPIVLGALAATILVAAAIGAFVLLRRPARLPVVSTVNPAIPSESEPLVGLPTGDEVRILAGSPRSYVDHAGKLWTADTDFSGGRAVLSPQRPIARTLDPSFYRTSRDGQFRYDIPLRRGVYELHLHFTESAWGPENSASGGEGSRLFDVRANGAALLTAFDIYADAGGGRIADDRVFPGLAPAADGRLHLEFAGERGAEATVSAIEILPGMGRRIRPVRLLARQTPYYSNDSHWWSPDTDFLGGQLATYSEPVTGTDDPELYESERWGNFSYAIPVSPGRYTVVLYFAGRHRPSAQTPPAGESQTATDRVFDVLCNGRAVLENFNLAREARDSHVVIRKISGVLPNAQGKLLLSFVPVQGYASVIGIEVLPE